MMALESVLNLDLKVIRLQTAVCYDLNPQMLMVKLHKVQTVSDPLSLVSSSIPPSF